MSVEPPAAGRDPPPLRCDLAAEDLLALVVHLAVRSEEARRARRKLAWSLPLLIVGVLGATSAATRDPRYLVIGAVIAPLWALVVWTQFDRIAQRQARAQAGRHPRPDLLGARALELAGEELLERGGAGVRRLPVRDIHRVIREAGHSFIFPADGAPIVIPHRGLAPRDLDDFLAALERRRAASRP